MSDDINLDSIERAERNGRWKGKTEATLEGIAERLDDIAKAYDKRFRACESRLAWLWSSILLIAATLAITHPREFCAVMKLICSGGG